MSYCADPNSNDCELYIVTQCSSLKSEKVLSEDEIVFFDWAFPVQDKSSGNPSLYKLPYALGRPWKGIADEEYGVAFFFENTLRIAKIEGFDASDAFKFLMYNLDENTGDSALEWMAGKGCLVASRRKHLLLHLYEYLKELFDISRQRCWLEKIWFDLKQWDSESVSAYHRRFIRNLKRMELLCDFEEKSEGELVRKFVKGLSSYFLAFVNSASFNCTSLANAYHSVLKYETSMSSL